MSELAPLLPKHMDIVILFHKRFAQPVTYGWLKDELKNLLERLNKEKK